MGIGKLGNGVVMPLYEALYECCSPMCYSEFVIPKLASEIAEFGISFYIRRIAMTRAPKQIGTVRIAPLSRLPTFFALSGKRAVVAGGSTAATWKAELLSAAGAQVDVFALPSEDMLALAGAPPNGAVIIQQRNWTVADFTGAAIAVADCPNDKAAAQFAAAARNAGVPVNVIDRPAFCDFSFGAIVNRSPLVIGISTEGASPVLGQAIRAKIEALIPQGFARWAAAALAWRPRLPGRRVPAER
jgi:siroheme synthase-like protein